MHEPDPINIPAYQRKRSIAAKARKKPAYLETALDRAMANKKKKSSKKPRQTKRYSTNNSSILEEIPIQNSVFPSQELFQNPFSDPLPKKSEFREMKTCGICEGYFDKIEVAIVKVTSPIRVGDNIIFEKQEGLFEQEVKSMQIDRKDINLATTGSEIGLKVYQKPTVGAAVYKVIK